MALHSVSTKPSKEIINQDKLQRGAKFIIEAIEGNFREGTERTPERVSRDWPEMFAGYNYNPEDILNKTFDSEGFDEMIIIDTEFYSTCEHHILPFWGKAWIGYIPKDRIIGLDKLVKLVWMFSRRLQNQERLTKQIADSITEILKPVGVMVVLKAEHGCIKFRGTNAQNSFTTTSCVKGVFRNNTKNTRNEFLALINK